MTVATRLLDEYDPSLTERTIAQIMFDLERLQKRLGTLRGLENNLEVLDADKSRGLVQAIMKMRDQRIKVFGPELFSDPAWDMLLELFNVHLAQQKISVSSLCIASSAPPTTALRWISTLTNYGWIQRSPDPLDRRRFFIKLSDKGLKAMEKLMAQWEIVL